MRPQPQLKRRQKQHLLHVSASQTSSSTSRDSLTDYQQHEYQEKNDKEDKHKLYRIISEIQNLPNQSKLKVLLVIVNLVAFVYLFPKYASSLTRSSNDQSSWSVSSPVGKDKNALMTKEMNLWEDMIRQDKKQLRRKELNAGELLMQHQFAKEALEKKEESKVLQQLHEELDPIDDKNSERVEENVEEEETKKTTFAKIDDRANEKEITPPEYNPTFQKAAANEFKVKFKAEDHIPLVIVTCKRADYLTTCLDLILKYHPWHHKTDRGKTDSIVSGVPIFISQDGFNAEVTSVIELYAAKFRRRGIPFHHIQFTDPIPQFYKKLKGKWKQNYYRLSAHYKFVLENVFDNAASIERRDLEMNGNYSILTSGRNNNSSSVETKGEKQRYKAAILLEEDLAIAPDFFEYMSHFYPLLIAPPLPSSLPLMGASHNNDTNSKTITQPPLNPLMAISAFNDNGRGNMINTNHSLGSIHVLRTDFFPGLGWMMPYTLWDEVRDTWPSAFWDDWLRDSNQRKGREFLRPEVSRTFHYGVKDGASFYAMKKLKKNLDQIHLNSDAIQWNEGSGVSVESLEKKVYDESYYKVFANATLVPRLNGNNEGVIMSQVKSGNLRMEYYQLDQFVKMAKMLGIMADEKDGVLRTAYKGIVEVRPDGGTYRLFIGPPLKEVRKSLLGS